jgi:hypothetical protein
MEKKVLSSNWAGFQGLCITYFNEIVRDLSQNWVLFEKKSFIWIQLFIGMFIY